MQLPGQGNYSHSRCFGSGLDWSGNALFGIDFLMNDTPPFLCFVPSVVNLIFIRLIPRII
ncbi:MAG: hypothetical protein A2Y88_05700 [Chloroflexi bacterium RBG_13_48_10]|nr:MAG: hypothetical protein A2Y88_05700 [Chloroflexi bacterium RBG_13_48_10]